MLFIYKNRPVSIEWTIRPVKGHSPLNEAPALKVLLWDGGHRYLINPTMVEGNTLSFGIPQDMGAATYGLYAIWIDRLRPGALSLNGKGFQDMAMRSMVRDTFALVEDKSDESDIVRTVLPTPGTPARLTLTSHAHPFGPDGLDAYEIAVLRGNGDDEALWLERLQEALLNIASLPADYITGDVNDDGTADSNDTAVIENLLKESGRGVLRGGDKLHAAMTKLDAFGTANRLLIQSNKSAQEATNREMKQSVSDLADKSAEAEEALKKAIADEASLSAKTDAELEEQIKELEKNSDDTDDALKALIDKKQDALTSYVRALATPASRVNQGAKYNFLQILYYLNEKTGFDTANIMGIDSTLRLVSTTSGGNTFPLLSVDKEEVTADEEKERKEADAAMQKQIDGETETKKDTTVISAGNIGAFVPVGNGIEVGETKGLATASGPGMVGSAYTDGSLYPISLKAGETISTSESGWVICKWESYGSSNIVSESDRITGMATGTYTAEADCKVLLFDPDGSALETGSESYTITGETKSLSTRIKELEAMVKTQASQIASLQTALSNVSYTISADDDQDPTT